MGGGRSESDTTFKAPREFSTDQGGQTVEGYGAGTVGKIVGTTGDGQRVEGGDGTGRGGVIERFLF